LLSIFKYLRYIITHKYYVMIECFKRGLFLQGLLHDISKLSFSEFIPYMNFFTKKDRSEEAKKAFNKAWLHHIHNNPHHWEYWIMPGKNVACEMPDKYREEMICDWIGAGIAITGKREFKEWYQENKDKIILHERTRNLIEVDLNWIF